MIKKMIKYKKTIGILSILIIMITSCGILYYNSGFKELKKNDTENIFVDEQGDENNLEENSAGGNITKNSKNNNKKDEVALKDKFVTVEIKGEVKKPDVYTLSEDAIVKELIEKAGGITENADLSNINRAKKLQNHEVIYIANINEKAKNPQNTSTTINSTKGEGNDNVKININSATVEDLKKLNGVGDAKAKSIIEYREQNGGFKSVEDIKNVKGFGGKMFEKIQDEIEV